MLFSHLNFLVHERVKIPVSKILFSCFLFISSIRMAKSMSGFALSVVSFVAAKTKLSIAVISFYSLSNNCSSLFLNRAISFCLSCSIVCKDAGISGAVLLCRGGTVWNAGNNTHLPCRSCHRQFSGAPLSPNSGKVN